MPGGGWQGHGSYSYMRLIKRCLFVVISSVFDYEKFKQFRTTRRFTMYSVETVGKWTKKKRKTGRKGSGALTHDSDRWQTKQGKQLSSQSNRCTRVIVNTTLHHWIGTSSSLSLSVVFSRGLDNFARLFECECSLEILLLTHEKAQLCL